LTELYPRFVRGLGHFSAQGVNLFYEMTFGQSTDRWIAGHETDLVDVLGDEKGGVSHPRTGQ
jgi:hypothetical protein